MRLLSLSENYATSFDIKAIWEKVAVDLLNAGITKSIIPMPPLNFVNDRNRLAYVKIENYGPRNRYTSAKVLPLNVSNYIKFNEDAIQNTICHEYIHAYLAANSIDLNEDPHGPMFLHYMDLVNQRTPYKVTPKKDFFDVEYNDKFKDSDVLMVILERDGKIPVVYFYKYSLLEILKMEVDRLAKIIKPLNPAITIYTSKQTIASKMGIPVSKKVNLNVGYTNTKDIIDYAISGSDRIYVA